MCRLIHSCQEVSQRGDDYGHDLSVWSQLRRVLSGLGEVKSKASAILMQIQEATSALWKHSQ